jgi:hypothetical protein
MAKIAKTGYMPVDNKLSEKCPRLPSLVRQPKLLSGLFFYSKIAILSMEDFLGVRSMDPRETDWFQSQRPAVKAIPTEKARKKARLREIEERLSVKRSKVAALTTKKPSN